MSYPVYFLIAFAYIIIGRYLVDNFFQWGKIGTTTKIISTSIILGTGLALLYLGLVYIPTQVFARQGLAKGVISGFKNGGRLGTYYEYKYALDRVYEGGGNFYGENIFEIGDTIDVIYNRDDIPMPNSFGYGPEPGSYLAYTRYMHIIGDWSVRKEYKKYLDKIQSSQGSKSKYLGVMP